MTSSSPTPTLVAATTFARLVTVTGIVGFAPSDSECERADVIQIVV